MTEDFIHKPSAGMPETAADVQASCTQYLDNLYDQKVLVGYWLAKVYNDEKARSTFVSEAALEEVGRRFPFLYARVKVTKQASMKTVRESMVAMGFTVAPL